MRAKPTTRTRISLSLPIFCRGLDPHLAPCILQAGIGGWFDAETKAGSKAHHTQHAQGIVQEGGLGVRRRAHNAFP
jgi:hypothetical protein